MARPARRGPSALRLEPLESRTLLNGSTPVSPAASLLGPSATAVAPVVTAQAQAQGVVPNDPNFKAQWGLGPASNNGIDASRAWLRTTGSPSIIVAVLDTGIDLSNPEFAGRIWTNPDSSGSDGYPGDVHGWNFVANNADVQDDNGHGTHVSGILAANANNGYGGVGVDWNAQIMPLKVLDANGNGTDAATVSAIDFAVVHGARVINASWGGGPFSQAVEDAISYAGSHGVVFVTAAGNNGTNNDTQPFYPASYHLPSEIAVAATDSAGNLAGFSNYGAGSVALAAPGVNILSTVPGGFAYESGTSMATPFVSGVVSLVAALHPTDSAAQLVQQVLSTTKPDPSLVGKTSTGGIVDAARALGIPSGGINHASGVHSFKLGQHAVSPLIAASTATVVHRRPAAVHRATAPRPIHPTGPGRLQITSLYKQRDPGHAGFPNS